MGIRKAEIGALKFPTPKAYEFLEMIIYVHEGKFTLLAEISVDDDFEGDVVTIGGKLSTLICNEENCIPYDVDLAIDIPVGEKTEKISAKSSLVEQAIKRWPVKPPVRCKFFRNSCG